MKIFCGTVILNNTSTFHSQLELQITHQHLFLNDLIPCYENKIFNYQFQLLNFFTHNFPSASTAI